MTFAPTIDALPATRVALQGTVILRGEVAPVAEFRYFSAIVPGHVGERVAESVAGSAALFSVQSLISLLTLLSLEIVLGIDNVIFIAILAGTAAARGSAAKAGGSASRWR